MVMFNLVVVILIRRVTLVLFLQGVIIRGHAVSSGEGGNFVPVVPNGEMYLVDHRRCILLYSSTRLLASISPCGLLHHIYQS